jgi:hypothetical protein
VWNPAWLEGNFSRFGWFGLSSIGTGAAGGTDGTTALFPLNLFGGPTGIQTGFYLYPALATQLTITAAAGNVIVSWPTNATGFSLQATTSLGPSAIWTTNFFTPITVDGQNTVTILVSGAQQFFRLSR